MQKTYLIPKAIVVELTHTHHILTGSDLRKVGDNYEGSLHDTNASSSGLAKGVSDVNAWDEDW